MNIYSATLIDPNKLLYNLVHNLGSIYDLTEELIWRSADFEKQGNTRYFWMRLGYIFGSNFQNLFEYPANYDYV